MTEDETRDEMCIVCYSRGMGQLGVEVERVQWGVGNGGFHSEDVCATLRAKEDPPLLRLVYDCGTMRRASLLGREVDEWAQVHSAASTVNGQLNVLIISHFDKDHVSGLKALHAVGFRPDHVILPFLSPEERSLQILRIYADSEDPRDGSQESDERDFAASLAGDPESTIRELWSNAQITFPNAPEIEIGDWANPTNENDTNAEADHPTIRIKPDEGLRIEINPARGTSKRAQRLFEYRWREHTTPTIAPAQLRNAVVSALAAALGVREEDVLSPFELLHALSQPGATATAARVYKLIVGKRDLNPYSIILWSGATNGSSVHTSLGRAGRRLQDGRCLVHFMWPLSGSWLGTGDATIVTSSQIDNLLAMVGAEDSSIDVMNAPHHGARDNSGNLLYARVPRVGGIVLAPADGRNGWGHPHDEVIRSAVANGCAMIRVGDSPSQRFFWAVSVY